MDYASILLEKPVQINKSNVCIRNKSDRLKVQRHLLDIDIESFTSFGTRLLALQNPPPSHDPFNILT